MALVRSLNLFLAVSLALSAEACLRGSGQSIDARRDHDEQGSGSLASQAPESARAGAESAAGNSAERPLWAPQEPPTAAWLAKVARTLRKGQGLSWEDDQGQLLKLDREQIVDHFMEDPRFLDTVLDFNLYFLGFKVNQLTNKSLQRYHRAAFTFPQAIHAAQEVGTNGDYLSLFDLEQPVYARPFVEPTNSAPLTLSLEERRAESVRAIRKAIDTIEAAFINSKGEFDNQKGCDELQTSAVRLDLFVAVLQLLPQDDSLDSPTFALNSLLDKGCKGPQGQGGAFRVAIDAYRSLMEGQIASMARFDQSVYKIKSLADIQAFPGIKTRELPYEFWVEMTNSSTNYNRKRAAYVLKTFFCDDLTPINIVAPESHASDRHASDPSCQACHYKLDPVAGFFRYRGADGLNFQTLTTLAFDDAARLDAESFEGYLDTWKASDSQKWNVGYIRSLTKIAANSYETDPTQSLAELFRVIKAAPESKRCLAKRLAEYFVSKEQVFDGTYLEDLTREISRPLASGLGFKRAVKALVLSRTFDQKNPNAHICYDPPEAQAAGNRCEISFIIDKNCKSCHAGGFDLEDASVKTEMLDRLQSADSRQRMPYRRDMPDTERVTLIKWLDENTHD